MVDGFQFFQFFVSFTGCLLGLHGTGSLLIRAYFHDSGVLC